MWRRAGKADGPITWVKPELVAQVKYAEITQDGIMRAPVFLGIREDKAARDVVGLEEDPSSDTHESHPDDSSPSNGVPVPDAVVVASEPPPDEPHTSQRSRATAHDGGAIAPEATAPAELDALLERLRNHTGEKLTLQVDGNEIAFSNLNKIFWPAHGDQRALTKRDLVVYFAYIAQYQLPHLRDRPLTLVRFPNGIHGGHFYQKHYEQPTPGFVDTVWLWSDHNKGDGEYLLINNLSTLLWLGQLADIELHTWYSRVDPSGDAAGIPTTFAGSLENMQQSVLNYPDFIVFDLDPYLYSGKEARGAEPELHPEGFAATSEVALQLKTLLDSLGVASFVKTTGRTGLHIYVPIVRNLDYHATHALSEALARYLEQQHPRTVTTEWAVDKRKGKVFVDYNQNVRGKTLGSIYSPRVLPWAAVSMPLRWDEVGGSVFPTDFTILTAPERLARVGDLWAPILESKHDLAKALETVTG
jgi:bifunctional non-homologous end joining protein LigD